MNFTENQTSATLLVDASFCSFSANVSTNNQQDLIKHTIRVWVCLSAIVCGIGVVTNLIVLAIILRYEVLRRGVGISIVHLLLIQLVYCAAAMPIAIDRVVTVSTLRGDGGVINCKACQYQHAFLVTVSTLVNWTEALLGLNRFVAVFFPHKFASFSRYSIQIFGLCCCWMSMLAATIPPAFEYHSIFRMSSIGTCAFVARSQVMAFLLSFNAYCPLTLIMVVAILIVARGTQRASTVKPGRVIALPDPRKSSVVVTVQSREAAPGKSTTSSRQARTSKMLLASFLFSLVLQVPQYATVLAGITARYPSVALFFWLTSMVQYAVTPVIFATMNQDYRNRLVGFFRSIVGGQQSALEGDRGTESRPPAQMEQSGAARRTTE